MYMVTVRLPYEGDYSEYFSTLDEVRDYIRKGGGGPDDVKVYLIEKEFDWWDLFP